MTDEHDAREDWFDNDDELDVGGSVPEDALPEDDLPEAELPAQGSADEAALDNAVSKETSGELLSTEQFEDELARLGDESDVGEGRDEDTEIGSDPLGDDFATLDDDDRLRGPRAQAFRRRLRTQISVLPLALYLIALGGFLLAREQNVEGLPDFSTLALVELSVLAVATTLVVHALLSGRRERGLLFLGLWVWTSAGLLALLVAGIDKQPDATKWWPVVVWALAAALLLTFLVERTHDARLVLLCTVIFVAGAAAYWVTSDRIGQSVLDSAADYWPLLFSALGVVLLPLAFRRRIG